MPGIQPGWCGLSTFLPCGNRPAYLPCPNFIEKREQLPLFEEHRHNLIELRLPGNEQLPADRKDDIASAVQALDQRIVAMDATRGQITNASPTDEPAIDGDQLATS